MNTDQEAVFIFFLRIKCESKFTQSPLRYMAFYLQMGYRDRKIES